MQLKGHISPVELCNRENISGAGVAAMFAIVDFYVLMRGLQVLH